MDVITTHINADFDSLASMLAAKRLYPSAALVFSGSQERSLRDFFIHSTLYAFEVEKLKNIDLRKVDRLIVVDTRQKNRIGKFVEILEKPGLEIHIYDHHLPSSDDFSGSVEVVAEVGATATLMVKVLRERGLELTPDEATVMLLGIYEDTGNLTFSSTREEDFMASGYLVRIGANLNVLSNMIPKELTSEQIFLLNDLIQSATRYHLQGVDIVLAQASVDHYIGDIALLVHKLKDMENLDVLFVLVRMEGRVYLIGRSRLEEVQVADVAREFGGGGHPTAASATLKGISLTEAYDRLIQVLKEQVKPRRVARDIMASPFKTVGGGQTIEEAGELLQRYRLNVLPVLSDLNVAGLISRQVVERALHHGLHQSLVKDYMTTEFSTVTPDASFQKVQELMIGRNQNLLPVIENNRLVGTITTGDVIRVLQEEMTPPRDATALESQPLHTRKKMITKLMKERLPERLKSLLEEIGRVGDELGYSVYAVGGFVRDLLMRVENFDIDLVVEGDGIRFAEALERRTSCRIRTHQKFGTAIIVFPDGLKIDVATARWETYDSPAALPTVERGSIKMDLYRRDFTMNTLAIQLNPRAYGEIIDFFGGLKDIKEKTVRVLHNLSFVEDPTRIFRAIRFEQRLGFQIGKHTQHLMRNSVKMGFLQRLSGRRILSELTLILKEESPLPALHRMKDFDLLRFLHPALKFDGEAQDLLDRIHHVISWFDLLFMEERYDRWLIYFYGLTDGLKEEDLQALSQRLALNEKERIRILAGRAQARQILLRFFSWIGTNYPPRRSEVYEMLTPLSMETKLFMMAKTTQTATRRYISLYFTQLKDIKPILKGIDLIRLGLKPGPVIKKALSNLLKARLDEMVSTRQDEMEFISKQRQASV